MACRRARRGGAPRPARRHVRPSPLPGSRLRSIPVGRGGRRRHGRAIDPIPNALVATITSTAPSRNARSPSPAAPLPARRGRRPPSAAAASRAASSSAPARRRVHDTTPPPPPSGPTATRARHRPARPVARVFDSVARSGGGPREAVDVLRRVRGRPRRPRISSRTTGVAVAVQASTRAAGTRPGDRRSPGTPAGSRAPFADAMRLVDGHQRDRHVAEEPAEALEDRRSGRRNTSEYLPCPYALRRRPPGRRGWMRGRSRHRRAASALDLVVINATSGEMTRVVPAERYRR